MKLGIQKIGLLLLCLAFASFGSPALAQNKRKGIFIVSESSKIPVADAYAQSDDLSFTANSDDNGFIDLEKLPGNVTALTLSRIGFELKNIDLSALTFKNNTAIIYLSNKVSSLAEVKLRTVPNNAVFKVISDLDIHLRPINNSQEILRMVPGLFIGQHAGGGKSEQIFLRGFDIDHGTDINLTVDGMPVNMVSHAHGQGYADLHWVIPEFIEKVNFNKGPYYAVKGNFTTAGFVEFKTKNYLEKNFVKVEGGQFKTFRGVTGINLLPANKTKRNQSLFFGGEASFTQGFFESPQDFKRFNGILKYHANVNAHTTLTATATGFTSKWNASGQIPDRAVADGSIGFYGAIDNTEGGETSRYNANIELRKNLKNNAVWSNQMFYAKNRFVLFSNFTFFKENPVDGDQIKQKENRNLFGFTSAYEKDFLLGKLSTQTKLGVQLRYDDVNDLALTRTKNRATVLEQLKLGEVNELNAGLYWAQKINFTKKLAVTTGLRGDYFANQYNDQLTFEERRTDAFLISPKLNVDVRVNNKVQLYVYNGRGFHSNDSRVAVQQNGRKVLPPAWGTDVGGIFKIGNKLILQSALWYLWLNQEFIYVGDEGIVEPSGKTRRVGIDFSARYELVKNLFADLDLSLADPRALNVPKKESLLPLAPRFTSVGGLTYRRQYGFNGSLRYRFMDDRPANDNNSVVAKGYFVTDAALNYTKPKWEAGFIIQNVFDVQWKETQFDTESKLKQEQAPVSEIHFTPGTPFAARVNFTIFF